MVGSRWVVMHTPWEEVACTRAVAMAALVRVDKVTAIAAVEVHISEKSVDQLDK